MVGLLPTDFPTQTVYQAGQPIDPYPVDVNPRPTQLPGTSTSGIQVPGSNGVRVRTSSGKVGVADKFDCASVAPRCWTKRVRIW